LHILQIKSKPQSVFAFNNCIASAVCKMQHLSKEGGMASANTFITVDFCWCSLLVPCFTSSSSKMYYKPRFCFFRKPEQKKTKPSFVSRTQICEVA